MWLGTPAEILERVPQQPFHSFPVLCRIQEAVTTTKMTESWNLIKSRFLIFLTAVKAYPFPDVDDALYAPATWFLSLHNVGVRGTRFSPSFNTKNYEFRIVKLLMIFHVFLALVALSRGIC